LIASILERCSSVMDESTLLSAAMNNRTSRPGTPCIPPRPPFPPLSPNPPLPCAASGGTGGPFKIPPSPLPDGLPPLPGGTGGGACRCLLPPRIASSSSIGRADAECAMKRNAADAAQVVRIERVVRAVVVLSIESVLSRSIVAQSADWDSPPTIFPPCH
jgi:hypothetical protein